MSEKERNKAGLHKKISSIFSGVLIPQQDSGRKPAGTSASEDADYTEPRQPDTGSLESESPETHQEEQILKEVEPEPARESGAEPAHRPEFITAQESEVEFAQQPDADIEEINNNDSDIKGAQIQQKNYNDHPCDKPVPEQMEYVVPEQPAPESKELESPNLNQNAEKLSDTKPAQQPKAGPVHAPKFMTAQESKVIPIEESEIVQVQETKDKPVSTSKSVTDQEPKVIPVRESEVESVKQSKTGLAHSSDPVTAKQTKAKTVKQPKVIPVRRFKADINNVSEKHIAVKIGKQNFLEQISTKLFTPKPGVSATKQKAMVVMVPVLFIALLIFVLKGGVFGTSVHNAEAGQENNVSGVAGLNAQIDWKIPEPYPTTLRDPMRLGQIARETDQTGSGELVKLTVKSILYSQDNSSAVINNRIVHENEQVRGANIIKINKDNVEFEMNGKTWTQEVQR